MHEVSVAEALLDRAQEHVPAGTAVREVTVRAGPLRAIEPEALRLAWSVIARGTPCEGARLRVEILPWRLCCLECGRMYEAPGMEGRCTCGSALARPVGCDDLTLRSLEVDWDTSSPTAGQELS